MIVDRLVIVILLLVPRGSDNFRALHIMNIGTKLVYGSLNAKLFYFYFLCPSLVAYPVFCNPHISGTKVSWFPFLFWGRSPMALLLAYLNLWGSRGYFFCVFM